MKIDKSKVRPISPQTKAALSIDAFKAYNLLKLFEEMPNTYRIEEIERQLKLICKVSFDNSTEGRIFKIQEEEKLLQQNIQFGLDGKS